MKRLTSFLTINDGKGPYKAYTVAGNALSLKASTTTSTNFDPQFGREMYLDSGTNSVIPSVDWAMKKEVDFLGHHDGQVKCEWRSTDENLGTVGSRVEVPARTSYEVVYKDIDPTTRKPIKIVH